MDYNRGNIFYIAKGDSYVTGCEIESGRPGIIVSNNKANACAPIVEIVYLTTQPKKPLPTHVLVKGRVMSTALCEGVYTIAKERVGDFIRKLTPSEMEMVDKTLLLSLGLSAAPKEEAPEDMNKVLTERELYKNLYEKLLDKVLPA